MKTSATELMKRLKFIEEDIESIHDNDIRDSYVPLVESTSTEGRKELVPAYEVIYDFAGNRARVKELYEEELNIKRLLNEHNQKTIISGYDYSISEGLIRLAQLKQEIKTLTSVSREGMYIRDGYKDSTKKATYNPTEVKEALRKAQHELSQLQVAIDRTNLMENIEY